MPNLIDVKAQLMTVGKQLIDACDELDTGLKSPKTPQARLNQLRNKKGTLQAHFDALEAEHRFLEAQATGHLEVTTGGTATPSISARADFYRSVLSGRRAPAGFNAATLIALPGAGGTGGEYLLPTQMDNNIVGEPFAKNPLRGAIRMSNIGGLVVPKVAFSTNEDSFIGDADTAHELSATGSQVTFGRFKTKVKCKVSDTVIHGTDTNLVAYIENALRSGLAATEKRVSFALDAAAPSDERHMSFYQGGPSSYAIDEVEGEGLFAAITAAIADLHEDFRDNAKVVMKYADYVTMLSVLANGSMELYAAQPEQIVGKPVIFCDSATVPIVGDFSYCQLNYDGTPTYDADKDVEAGVYIFVLTAWLDQWRLLNSAFRLAVDTSS